MIKILERILNILLLGFMGTSLIISLAALLNSFSSHKVGEPNYEAIMYGCSLFLFVPLMFLNTVFFFLRIENENKALYKEMMDGNLLSNMSSIGWMTAVYPWLKTLSRTRNPYNGSKRNPYDLPYNLLIHAKFSRFLVVFTLLINIGMIIFLGFHQL